MGLLPRLYGTFIYICDKFQNYLIFFLSSSHNSSNSSSSQRASLDALTSCSI